MKKQNVIYHANGENQGTYGPLCFAENFTGDINERCTRFMSWDFDMPVEVERYRDCTISMPDWMQESQYLSNHVGLEFAVGLAGTSVYEMNPDQFFRFIDLGERMQYWYGWALKQKSAFIQSLLANFQAWLNGENEYKSPLSQAQWEAGIKFCPLYKAKQISNKLYYSRMY